MTAAHTLPSHLSCERERWTRPNTIQEDTASEVYSLSIFGTKTPLPTVLALAAAVTLATGIGEEVLFRGLIQEVRKLGVWFVCGAAGWVCRRYCLGRFILPMHGLHLHRHKTGPLGRAGRHRGARRRVPRVRAQPQGKSI